MKGTLKSGDLAEGVGRDSSKEALITWPSHNEGVPKPLPYYLPAIHYTTKNKALREDNIPSTPTLSSLPPQSSGKSSFHNTTSSGLAHYQQKGRSSKINILNILHSILL
ncbi:hypothetical protein E2C01_060564 [Portunus trituberculatus]|uniref:Uncharacterized protein n=1 Tax=Portunus trituberculatus TaxID=210409 RepID=A0A5B7HAU2_PORTR|nr:hypothetical protein [Portunus trituberculatus]